jgi:hypothetical protein
MCNKKFFCHFPIGATFVFFVNENCKTKFKRLNFRMYSSFIVELDKDLLEFHEYINYGKVEITLTM